MVLVLRDLIASSKRQQGALQWEHESCVKAGTLLLLWGGIGECAWVTLVGREAVREEVSFKSDGPYPQVGEFKGREI